MKEIKPANHFLFICMLLSIHMLTNIKCIAEPSIGLKLDPASIDLGVLSSGAPVSITKVECTNVSDKEITIQKVVPSCSCVGLSITTMRLAPGAKAVLTVKVDTNNKTGKFVVAAAVVISEAESRYLTLTINGYVANDIQVNPEVTILEYNGNKQPADSISLFLDNRVGNWHVDHAVSEDNLLKIAKIEDSVVSKYIMKSEWQVKANIPNSVDLKETDTWVTFYLSGTDANGAKTQIVRHKVIIKPLIRDDVVEPLYAIIQKGSINFSKQLLIPAFMTRNTNFSVQTSIQGAAVRVSQSTKEGTIIIFYIPGACNSTKKGNITVKSDLNNLRPISIPVEISVID